MTFHTSTPEETQALAEQLLIEETFTREEVLALFGQRPPENQLKKDCPEEDSSAVA